MAFIARADTSIFAVRKARLQERVQTRGAIAHVVNSTRWGGMEARTLETAAWQAEQGHRVVVVTPREGALFQEARRLRLQTHEIDFDAPGKLDNLRRMRAIFSGQHVRVADFHTNRSLALGVRDLATLVRSQHILRRGGKAGLRFNKEFPFDGFILSSQAGSDVLVEQGYARPERVGVVGEWADDAFFVNAPSPAERSFRKARLGVAAGDFVIGAAAMLRPDNAFDDLIRATARLNASGLPVTCLVAGGPMHLSDRPCAQELELRALARTLGIEAKVHFVGHRTDVADVLSAMDVVAVVSRHTAQTRAAPEAAAVGRPVVAFDVGALRETMAPGRTGLLTPLGDVDAFAAAIGGLLGDAVRCERMATEAARYAREHFRKDIKMRQTLQVYDEAMARRRLRVAAPGAPRFPRPALLRAA